MIEFEIFGDGAGASNWIPSPDGSRAFMPRLSEHLLNELSAGVRGCPGTTRFRDWRDRGAHSPWPGM